MQMGHWAPSAEEEALSHSPRTGTVSDRAWGFGGRLKATIYLLQSSIVSGWQKRERMEGALEQTSGWVNSHPT